MKKLRLLVILCLILIKPLYCESDQMVLLTMQKAGTHLLLKYFYLLEQLGKDITTPKLEHVYCYDYKNGMIPWKEERKIILIRDLRDITISATFWVIKSETHRLSHHPWFSYTLPKKIMYFINGTDHSIRSKHPYFHCLPLNVKNVRRFMEWGNYYIVKFENLIGPNGGGSEETQLTEIYNLAHEVNVTLTPEEAQYIATNLFGIEDIKDNAQLTPTFNKGKIGRWKKYFNDKHKKRFKKLYNDFLVEFGYEEDDNW